MAAPSIIGASLTTGSTGSGSSLSTSYTPGVGTDTMLVMMFASSDIAGGSFSATFNSVSFTYPVLSNTNLTCRYMYLVAPTAGSHTFTLTFGGTGNCSYALFTVQGADQFAPIDMDESANGNSTTPSVAGNTIADEVLVLSSIATSQDPTVDGAGFSELFEVLQSIYNNGASKTVATAAAATSSWSKAGGVYDAIIFGIKPPRLVTVPLLSIAIAFFAPAVAVAASLASPLLSLILGMQAPTVTQADPTVVNTTKNSASMTNTSKSAATFVNTTKNSATFTNTTKNNV